MCRTEPLAGVQGARQRGRGLVQIPTFLDEKRGDVSGGTLPCKILRAPLRLHSRQRGCQDVRGSLDSWATGDGSLLSSHWLFRGIPQSSDWAAVVSIVGFPGPRPCGGLLSCIFKRLRLSLGSTMKVLLNGCYRYGPQRVFAVGKRGQPETSFCRRPCANGEGRYGRRWVAGSAQVSCSMRRSPVSSLR